MTLKQQPQIRVIDTESEYFGDICDVLEIAWRTKTVLVELEKEHDGVNVNYDKCFRFESVQELTPLSHDGVRIGENDFVRGEYPGQGGKVSGWYKDDGSVVLIVQHEPGPDWHAREDDIIDHTPLTDMKKEENKPHQPEKEKWEYEPRKDCILCDLEERGGMVHSNVHFSHHDKLEKEDNDKPTIERIDRPDPYDRHSDNMVSLDVPEVAAVLIEMFEQQKEILEALADSGIINLEDNNE